jgi:hypothetical protein
MKKESRKQREGGGRERQRGAAPAQEDEKCGKPVGRGNALMQVIDGNEC